MNQGNDQETILALERGALKRWCKGDPSGFGDIAADEVSGFDHTSEARVDGIAALKQHFSQYEGKVNVPRFEMPNAMVRLHHDIAVLTFNWHTYAEDGRLTSRWNATEVYSHPGGQWKLLHSHWSRAQTG
jgi:ketosteroid isomerase-like protein